jgi:hypothetical protein
MALVLRTPSPHLGGPPTAAENKSVLLTLAVGVSGHRYVHLSMHTLISVQSCPRRLASNAKLAVL